MSTTTRAVLDLERLDAALPTREFATVLLCSDDEPRLVVTARRDVRRCVEVFVEAEEAGAAYWFGGDHPRRMLDTQLARMTAAHIGKILGVY